MRLLSVAAMILVLGLETGIAAPASLVPQGWREVETSESRGGARTFVSSDGAARLRLGHVQARRENLRRDMDALMYRNSETITYKRRGRSWLVVSGYRDGEIFYRKSNLACKGTRWHTVELRYPQDAKRRLDPVVTSIARGMGAYGEDCG
jgi:hypothetical protein